LLNGDSVIAVTLSSSGAASSAPIGTYAIVASSAIGSGLGNYSITYASTTLSVRPAPLTLTANAASKTYDGLTYSGGNGVSASGFVNGETASVLGGALAYGGSAQGAINAGSYNLTVAGLISNNYAISYAPSLLTVATRPLTLIAAAQSRVYGAPNPSLTFTIGGDGLVDGDTLSGQLQVGAIKTSAIGSYAIGQGDLSVSNNYALTFSGADLTVTATLPNSSQNPKLFSDVLTPPANDKSLGAVTADGANCLPLNASGNTGFAVAAGALCRK
jgi:hypothetical protein